MLHTFLKGQFNSIYSLLSDIRENFILACKKKNPCKDDLLSRVKPDVALNINVSLLCEEELTACSVITVKKFL